MSNAKSAKFRVHILINSVFAQKKKIPLHFNLIAGVILAGCSLLTRKPSYLKQAGGGEKKDIFGKESAAFRLLMHLNPQQKMKSLWAGAKQHNNFPLISGRSTS